MRRPKTHDYSPMVMKGILHCVSIAVDLSVDDILSGNRQWEILEARQLTLYFITKALPDVALATIGRYFNIHYGTIIHAVNKVEDMLAIQDPSFVKKMNQITIYCAGALVRASPRVPL